MRPLIDQELSVVFYDLTTVRIHGEHVVDQDVRAFGASKEGGVARQFMLSLVQTADGLPIAHEVHPGNTAEAKHAAADDPQAAGALAAQARGAGGRPGAAEPEQPARDGCAAH
jgi:hypothetical protein